VQDTEELLSAAIDDIVEQPELMLIPLPETAKETDFADVSPLFCTFRLTVYVEPALTENDVGLADKEIEGGRITLKLLDSAVSGEPVPAICAFIFMFVCVCEMLAVVQLTLVVPELNAFDVPSSVENPVGVSIKLTVPLSLRPETVIVNALPFIMVPESAPDCVTATVAAWIVGTTKRIANMNAKMIILI
jgi:hypothetical protein